MLRNRRCAGTITGIGAGVTGFEPGQRVMALLSGGGYAEETVVPAVCVMHTPDGLTDEEAAGVPGVFITAFLDLFLIGGRMRPVVDRVVPLDEVADAHRAMAAGEIFGKLILKVG